MAEKDLDEIKKLIRDEKLIFGRDIALKKLRLGKVEKIFLAKNCNEELKKDIEYYKNINKFEVAQLSIPNDELGMICKKPFSISIAVKLKEKA